MKEMDLKMDNEFLRLLEKSPLNIKKRKLGEYEIRKVIFCIILCRMTLSA